jgi:hypothetical protein
MSRALARARDVLAEIIVASIKIAAAIVVLYVLGTLAGCGGSVEGEQDDDKSTIDPVLCLPSDAGARGCAK